MAENQTDLLSPSEYYSIAERGDLVDLLFPDAAVRVRVTAICWAQGDEKPLKVIGARGYGLSENCRVRVIEKARPRE